SFVSQLPRPPHSPLFPYTTLFRSFERPHRRGGVGSDRQQPVDEQETQAQHGVDDGDADHGGLRNARTVTKSVPETDRADEWMDRSEEHTSELQSLRHLVCRLLLEK